MHFETCFQRFEKRKRFSKQSWFYVVICYWLPFENSDTHWSQANLLLQSTVNIYIKRQAFSMQFDMAWLSRHLLYYKGEIQMVGNWYLNFNVISPTAVRTYQPNCVLGVGSWKWDTVRLCRLVRGWKRDLIQEKNRRKEDYTFFPLEKFKM